MINEVLKPLALTISPRLIIECWEGSRPRAEVSYCSDIHVVVRHLSISPHDSGIEIISAIRWIRQSNLAPTLEHAAVL
jgi:hypothetical protein